MNLPIDFKPSLGVDTTEYDTVINWQEDDIVYIFAKAGVKHTLKDAIKQLEFVQSTSSIEKKKLLLDLRVAPALEVEARDYYGSDEVQQVLAATCIIAKSRVSKFIGNFYLHIFNKQNKTHIVSEVLEGVEWLNNQKS